MLIEEWSSTMADCIFCSIINGDSPARIVYSNDSVVAFLDINPRTPGHTLLIPAGIVGTFSIWTLTMRQRSDG